MKIHEKPWKFGQLLGKIKKIRAHLSENMLKSVYSLQFPIKIWANLTVPPPGKHQSRSLMKIIAFQRLSFIS
jgi:hypothetical protein